MADPRTAAREADWRELPDIRKVGRYLFFALCAYGIGMVSYAAVRGLGLSRDAGILAASVAEVAAFLALRDMSAQWAWALKVQAAAIRALIDTGEEGHE